MELIDKSTLVEEIKKCEKICENYMLSHKDAISQGIANAKSAMCQHIIKIINTLEVKEVDLDELLSNLDKDIKEFVTTEEFEKDSAVYGHYWAIAKHAFELGLKIKINL